MSPPVTVDIWSDVACPWCYIGKRRFEAGMEAYRQANPDAEPPEVVFHSFQLSPGTPNDFDGTAAQFLAQHLGVPVPQAAAMQEQTAAIAADEGLAFDFPRQKVANTRLAHQLLHLAKREGMQWEMKERLQAAHWLEGRHVGQVPVLADLAAEVGIDRDIAVEGLGTSNLDEAVQTDIDTAARLGISGVPFFVFDGRLGMSGAQPAEAFVRAFDRAHADRLGGVSL